MFANLSVFLKELIISIELAKTELKTGVEGTYLGILWYLLDPLFFFLIIISVRGFIRGADFLEYPLYLIIGLIIYHFFSQSTIRMCTFAKSVNNFAKSSNLSYNCLFFGKFFKNLYLHFFELVILFIFIIIFAGSFIGFFVYVFIILFLFSIFTIGVSFFLTVLCAFVPDFSKVWHLLMRLLRFVMPIFFVFDEGSLPYLINLFNPVFYFLEVSRSLIIGFTIPNLFFIIMIIILPILFLISGYFVFKKYNKFFSELVE